MSEPISLRADAATAIFNLRTAADSESVQPAEAGCPSCGVISSRLHSRRQQRLRGVPLAGPVEVVWTKRRLFCAEGLCPQQTFTEETAQVPRRTRSTRRLRDALVATVIRAGRAATEAASSFGVSWWLVQRALDSGALTLPDVGALEPRMPGIDQHRYRSVRFFRDPATKAWKPSEPWMATIVDLDTGQVLGRDREGLGDWLFARPLEWRLGVQVVAIDPSAAFRKASRM
ncbi:hypothetical protein ARTHRO9AX_180341 [Arthrobacter sp. 9AX]|nr:transposase family protein [Arthrobacter sp. 9AX]VXB55415.1 hypothetical protein ARTHRO9AX_180341 [Arthrobacter sp. 9AX]